MLLKFFQASDQERANNQARGTASGDALSMAFEMVATPALFAFFGYLLDRAVGTAPLFILVFSIVVLTYVVWRTFKTYERRMKKFERRVR